MEKTWNEFQKEIFKFVEKGKGNAAINAVAGSGKTTTIVEAAKRIKCNKETLFIAFNKDIVRELSTRLPENVSAKTLHAHGLSAIKKCNKFVKVVSDRYYNSIKEQAVSLSNILTIDDAANVVNCFKDNVRKILNLCRVNLIEPKDIDSIENIAYHNGIMCIADETSVVSYFLESAYSFPQNKTIDFTDMLTLSVKVYGNFVDKYDFVFIDECQDLSKAQRELMLLSLKKNGRFIAVGDKRQAINGFAGADCDSFNYIANLPNTKTLPLSVNYRCGKKIIAEAQRIVPEIKAFDGQKDGTIQEVTNFDNLKSGDMVLCRLTAPLVSLCLKFWAKGIRAYVKGTDIGKSLICLVDKQKTNSISNLYGKLEKEKEKIIKQLDKNGVKSPTENGKYLALCDKIDCIHEIADTCVTNGLKELKEKLDKLFSDETENRKVCLSTIHKSKGLEANNVWIIRPDKLPLVWKNQLSWQYEQEINLKYVAITRAKEVLNIVTLTDEQLKKL